MLYLTPENSIVVVVDWQERLAAAMDTSLCADKAAATVRLLGGAAATSVPVLVTEQYPKGLGPTVSSVREALGAEYQPIEKRDFSCLDVPAFAAALEESGRSHVVLAGMEAHICVFQTARALVEEGYVVHVALDAVLSRRRSDFDVARSLYDRLGVVHSSVETVMFDWVRRAEGPAFKAISKLVR